jgi:ArsR family transcriptional regulator
MAARVLRAMGHPIRLGVLNTLRDGPKTVTELFHALGCSQSMMSQQIQVLEYHGLVSSRKDGTHKYCSLTNPDMLGMLDCLRRHLRENILGAGIGSMQNT